jgi:hypothetical protein
MSGDAVGINLFGIEDDEQPSAKDAADNKQPLEQQSPGNQGSDAGEYEPDGNVVAGANTPGEVSGGGQIAAGQAPGNDGELDGDVVAEADTPGEISGGGQVAAGQAPGDDDEFEDEADEDDTPDEESDGEQVAEDQAPEDEDEGNETDEDDTPDEESDGEQVAEDQTPDDDDEDEADEDDTPEEGKSGKPDPKFAEKVTGDVHADESAPQTEPISKEHVPPLAAQSIDYQKPSIEELKKQPVL